MASPSGWPVWQGTYLPFGYEWNGGTTPAASHYKFTGKERDTETSNDYFGARYYNSSMGRFLSPDWSAKVVPVPYADLNDPQSLNLYGYVRNRPTFAVDKDGHDWWDSVKSLFNEVVSPIFNAGKNEGRDDGRTQVAVAPVADSRQTLTNLTNSAASGIEKATDLASVGDLTGMGGALKAGAKHDTLGAALSVVGGMLGSGEASGFAPGKLLSHFEDHGAEFGFKTAGEYLNGARALTAGGDGIETVTRANGEKIFYKASTNEFGALRANGTTIKTYFKPKQGAAYWEKQVAKAQKVTN